MWSEPNSGIRATLDRFDQTSAKLKYRNDLVHILPNNVALISNIGLKIKKYFWLLFEPWI